jgi:hypothetical protein
MHHTFVRNPGEPQFRGTCTRRKEQRERSYQCTPTETIPETTDHLILVRALFLPAALAGFAPEWLRDLRHNEADRIAVERLVADFYRAGERLRGLQPRRCSA